MFTSLDVVKQHDVNLAKLLKLLEVVGGCFDLLSLMLIICFKSSVSIEPS